MTVEITRIEPRSPAWLALRKRLLTASDVGAVAGVDPFKSPLRVYAEKTGLVPDLVENSAMRRGRHFETAALEYLAEEKPDWLIERPNVFITDHKHRLGCTPDAYATDEDGQLINVQIKTVNRHSFERWNGVPPLGYRLQVVCENMLTDATRGVLAVWWYRPMTPSCTCSTCRGMNRPKPASGSWRWSSGTWWNRAAARRPTMPGTPTLSRRCFRRGPISPPLTSQGTIAS